MIRKYPPQFLVPAIKAHLLTELAAVDILGTPQAIPVYEWGSHFNEDLPYVIIGNDGESYPDDSTHTMSNITEITLQVYSDSQNQGVFEVNAIANGVVGALHYQAPNSARAAIGVRLDVPGFIIIGAEPIRIPARFDNDTNAHRRLVVMEYTLNQVS